MTVGRCTGVNREDRVCNKSIANVVDEFHILFEFTNEETVKLRDMYKTNIYTLRPTHLKYITLMQSTSVNVL